MIEEHKCQCMGLKEITEEDMENAQSRQTKAAIFPLLTVLPMFLPELIKTHKKKVNTFARKLVEVTDIEDEIKAKDEMSKFAGDLFTSVSRGLMD